MLTSKISTKKIQVGCPLVCTFAVIVMGILRNWQESKLLTPRIPIPHRTDPPTHPHTHTHTHTDTHLNCKIRRRKAHIETYGVGTARARVKARIAASYVHAAYVRKSYYAERFQRHTQPPYRATLMAYNYIWRLTECTKSPAPSTLTHVASVVHIEEQKLTLSGCFEAN